MTVSHPARSATRPSAFTVSELAARVRQCLDLAFPTGVWVDGEIDSITRARRGHVYFNLVERPEDDHSQTPSAVVSVVLFNEDRLRVNRMIRRFGNAMRINNGVKVRIQGVVDFYAQRGQLQLRMISIDPSYTLGALAAHRAAVIARLDAEGLLNRNATLDLPAVPLQLGLVTSLGSAAHADVLRVLSDSGFGFVVREVDATVQGRDAPASITSALSVAASHGELVVLARGGGSSTDLVAFDDYSVARAIACCVRPVFCGIGHQTDHSAADQAAHSAFSTPTAAAEAVVRRVRDWLARLDEVAISVAQRGRAAIERVKHHNETIAAATARNAVAATRVAHSNLSAIARHVQTSGQAALDTASNHIDSATTRLVMASQYSTRNSRRHLDAIEARVNALDPASLLRRGWSLTRGDDGQLIRSVHDVEVATSITTHLADGTLTSTIESLEVGARQPKGTR